MPPESLSDDFRDWPKDPYELLGITEETDERGLRRAYNQLVKRFSPERFPDHFMRVRQAYEWLQRFVEFRGQFAIEESIPECTDTSPAATPLAEFAPTSTVVEDPDALARAAWQRAIDGDHAGAYRQLCALVERHAQHKNTRLQLFWLLRLDASLDPDRSPGEWLTPAVSGSPPWSRPWWVYLQWLDHSAIEATSSRCAELMQLPTSRPHLRQLLQARWKWATVDNRWECIRDDLNTLRGQFIVEDRKIWMSVLFLAADFLAWRRRREAITEFKACLEALRDFEEYEIEASAAFDRLADLQILAETWQATAVDAPIQRANSSQRQLVELVRYAWNRSGEETAEFARQLIDGWVGNPPRALEELDSFATLFPDQYLIALHSLFAEINRSHSPLSRDERRSQITPVISAGLLSAELRDYPSFRSAMLRLALRESVTVDEIVEVGLEAVPNDRWTDWCQPLYNDLPLRTVTTAVAAYWS